MATTVLLRSPWRVAVPQLFAGLGILLHAAFAPAASEFWTGMLTGSSVIGLGLWWHWRTRVTLTERDVRCGRRSLPWSQVHAVTQRKPGRPASIHSSGELISLPSQGRTRAARQEQDRQFHLAGQTWLARRGQDWSLPVAPVKKRSYVDADGNRMTPVA
jgi:hypothetical protein